jgi:predicted nucleotidyltransferase
MKTNHNNRIYTHLAKHKPELVNKFGVQELGIFGSSITGKANKTSDVDILLQFKPGYKTFNNYMELKFYLERILRKKVDLVLASALREELKEYILPEVVYV